MACQDASAGSATASSPNAVSISSPHITQVRVPRQDDGKWMSIGAMVGSILGKWANKDLIDKAEDAEDIWREMTDTMREVGIDEFTTRAQAIRECNDNIWQKFCDYVLCGYKPDYDGILARARADASVVTLSKKAEARRHAKRYNVGINANVMSDFLRSEILATVGAATAARENERQFMWKANTDLIGNAAIRFEQAYQGRLDLGAKLVSSAGENYAYLAESLRRTAEKNTSGLAELGALVGALVTIFCGPDIPCNENEDCCSD